MRWHFTIIRMDFFFKKNSIFWQRYGEIGTHFIAIGNAKWAVAIEYSLADVQKLNI